MAISIKLIFCLFLILETCITTPIQPDLSSHLSIPTNLQRIEKQLVPSTVHLQLTRNISTKASPILNLDPARNALVISTVQLIIDNVFAFVRNLASSLIVASANISTFIQTNVVSPLLTLFNTLAGLTVVQSYEPLYLTVLIIQSLLTVANQTLVGAFDILSNGTSIVVTGVEGVIDSIFSFILSFL